MLMKRAALAWLPLGLSTMSSPVAGAAMIHRVGVTIPSCRTLRVGIEAQPTCTLGRSGLRLQCPRSGTRSFAMSTGRTTPNDAELQNVALACSHLWDLDSGRLQPGIDYELDLQSAKRSSWDEENVAAAPLFKFVKDHVFQRETVQTFVALLDNYVSETGTTETITREEAKEDMAFLHAILKTAPMIYAMRYLFAKGHLKDESENEMRRLVQHIWFRPYRRETRNDSSGFEHVFVGEIRDTEVVGLHNWIRIFMEEKCGNLNYYGYIRSKSDAASPQSIDPHHDQVVSLQFQWKGHMKPIGTSFIGTSPEFEVALYTLCYLFGESNTLVKLGPYVVDVKVHPIAGKFLGAAYPSEPKN